MNVGVPSCVAPWIPVVSTGVPSGITGVTVGVYFAVTGVPFLSTRFTVTPFAVPVNCGSGVNVTLPSLSTVYVPSPGTTTFPSGFAPSNVGATSSSIGTLGLPGLNVGVPSCLIPWSPVVSAGVPSGVTGVTVGTYFFVTTLPFSSSTWTVTPSAVPVNVLTGVKVIAPSFNSYVPTSGTVIVVTFSPFPLTNVNVSCFNSTLSWPVSKFTVVLSDSSFWLNTIGDVWAIPCGPVVAESLPVGVTSITVGV